MEGDRVQLLAVFVEEMHLALLCGDLVVGEAAVGPAQLAYPVIPAPRIVPFERTGRYVPFIFGRMVASRSRSVDDIIDSPWVTIFIVFRLLKVLKEKYGCISSI